MIKKSALYLCLVATTTSYPADFVVTNAPSILETLAGAAVGGALVPVACGLGIPYGSSIAPLSWFVTMACQGALLSAALASCVVYAGCGTEHIYAIAIPSIMGGGAALAYGCYQVPIGGAGRRVLIPFPYRYDAQCVSKGR
jgi:hypothetical protein